MPKYSIQHQLIIEDLVKWLEPKQAICGQQKFVDKAILGAVICL